MYIRRKVYSLLQDENGEERYFSTTDFELTDGAKERYYSEKKKKKNKISLDKVDSHRGLGRSLLIGGVPGALGAYAPQLIKVYGGKKGALGAAAGHFGAKKNAKERLKKRAYMEKEN